MESIEKGGEQAKMPVPYTQFQNILCDHISKILGVTYEYRFYDARTRTWKPQNKDGPFNPGVKYKLQIIVRNNGLETFVKDIQIRVYSRTSIIVKYTDSSYTTVVNQATEMVSAFPSKVYKPTPDGTTPGEATPPFDGYFMMTQSTAGNEFPGDAFKIGIYGEIVPEGNFWITVQMPLLH